VQKREIIFRRTSVFIKKWNKLGYDDNDQEELESILADNPEAGNIIRGSGGIRKLRYSLPGNGGKRSGARVCFYLQGSEGTIFLMLIYPKNEKNNLTKKEINQLRGLVKALKL